MIFSRGGPCSLLLLLAVVAIVSDQYAAADSCMQRWLRLAGDESHAAENAGRLARLGFDEEERDNDVILPLLPVLLNGGSELSTSLLQCLKKEDQQCFQQAACTPKGVCKVNMSNWNYYCECPVGLRGEFCQEDIDECQLRMLGCHSNASCNNTHGSYNCSCKAGYQGNGTMCTDVNECASSPCQNGGSCENLQNAFHCICPSGLTGNTCQEDVNECASDPCQNGGKCIDQRDGFVCVCTIRYDGELCQHSWLHRNFFLQLEKRLMAATLKQSTELSSDLQIVKDKVAEIRKYVQFTSRSYVYRSELDGGYWNLVWKHSYLQVPRSLYSSARTFSKVSETCKDLSDGWCNVPNKQLAGATEQMIAAFHHGTVVYAYKSPLNPNLGVTEQGARLMSGWSKIVDKCVGTNGIRPDIFTNSPPTDGIAFDKASPDHVRFNSDTIVPSGADHRWNNCGLPPSISRTPRYTQMTLAIFVR